MNNNFNGINKLQLDLPSQVEFNRRKNVEQDEQIATINTNLSALMAQNPAGYLPRVYYGLLRGSQTYRFPENYTLSAPFNEYGTELISQAPVGTAFEFYQTNETSNAYIPAVFVKEDENTLRCLIRGDYLGAYEDEQFSAINMTTGIPAIIQYEDETPLAQYAGSSLSDYPAEDNKEKQITVLNDLENNSKNVVFASIDINNDGTYNWVNIANFADGKDGKSCIGINSSNASQLIGTDIVKVGDTLIATENFTYAGINWTVGTVYYVDYVTPSFSVSNLGSIRGPQGATGATGADGTDGTDGYTPYIQDGYWYINSVNTNVKAIGTDGTDGVNGQSFTIQSGLYSKPSNYGQTGNVGPNGETLLQLPTLPTTNLTGKGYVVYDPLTTPLDPSYDLYWANDGDMVWTIMLHYNGTPGTNGTDGYTPYIQSGYWYINGVNTGVLATGPQGPTGPTGPAGATFSFDSGTGVLTITTPGA